MPNGSTLLLFAGASLALLAVPGPAVIYVVTRSLDQGRAAGIVSMLGVETGTFAYALAAAAGLTADRRFRDRVHRRQVRGSGVPALPGRAEAARTRATGDDVAERSLAPLSQGAARPAPQ